MPIVDFRLRPPSRGFLATKIYANAANRDRYTRRLGFEPAASVQAQSMPLLLQEMDAAGITRGIVVGRTTATLGSVPNEDVAAIVAENAGRFIGIGSADTTDRRRAVAMIEECRRLGLAMVNLEPGVMEPPLHADDRRLYPIYAHCEDTGMPLVIMAGGGAGPDITYTAPAHMDRMLADFPKLTVICSHGGWPWVQEMVSVAFRRPNLYLCPDMYLIDLPGMDDYLRAANSFLAEQLLFGTAYPFCPLGPYVERFMQLDIKVPAREMILWRNADRLLDLSLA
ncbi:amidohydrolase family protein [Falsiroseomonas ponticola]|uniref:amidohydrolase family protein n=1 Tax=Falsiroseomonas ponticola TaxID=2786951 RepID=UPI0019324743|nr:amidohydrolase family protein [Roseomonas ponticola]